MPFVPRFRLSEAEKDSLLAQQQDMIERLVARVSELETLVGKPRKTSGNCTHPIELVLTHKYPMGLKMRAPSTRSARCVIPFHMTVVPGGGSEARSR